MLSRQSLRTLLAPQARAISSTARQNAPVAAAPKKTFTRKAFAKPTKPVAPKKVPFQAVDTAGSPDIFGEAVPLDVADSAVIVPDALSAEVPTEYAAPSYTEPTPVLPSYPVEWETSFHGISSQPVSKEAANILMRPLEPSEIEIKPDGLLYLPEIHYRRILNRAFGPGGWGMVPRGELMMLEGLVSREWALLAQGRLISIARGEQAFFSVSGLPTAAEGCKSNALMRCCKDLGIASELWDPGFIRSFKAAHCVEAWTEHVVSKKKQRRWRKKGNKFEYPLQEAKN